MEAACVKLNEGGKRRDDGMSWAWRRVRGWIMGRDGRVGGTQWVDWVYIGGAGG